MVVIQELLKLYSEINIIYIELRKLEVVNTKNNDKFNSLVDLLKKDLNRERKLFNDIFISNELEYEELYKILDECTDRPFSIRARDYIDNNDMNDIKIYEGMEKDVIKTILDNIKYSKLYDACSRNIFLIYLSFLQEYADSSQFDYLRERILNFKYYNSFINHNIESILIDSSFNVDRINYVNLDFIASRLNLADSDDIILDCYLDTIKTSISQLLSINDIEYNDDSRLVVSLNNQSMLRAGLAMLSERDYNIIINSVFDEYEGMCTDYNKISTDIINSIFDGRKKDKSRVRKISLKPIEE